MPKLLVTVWFLFLVNVAYGAGDEFRVLCVGDSLTEGYGLPKEDSYPALMQATLNNKGKGKGFKKIKVVNAGTSGATTSSSMSTLKFHFKRLKPNLVVYALGANDGLRGVKVDKIKANMDKAIDFVKKQNVPLILVGMQAPPNYGRKFPESFASMYPSLAEKYKVPLVPFLLEGVAGQKEFNLPDGIHPNKEGYKIVVKNIMPSVEKFIPYLRKAHEGRDTEYK